MLVQRPAEPTVVPRGQILERTGAGRDEPDDGPVAIHSGAIAVVAVLAFCGTVVSLMQTLVLPLLPRFPELLGTTRMNASWLATSTLLAGAIATPLLGRFGDMFGKRRMLLFSLGVLTGGSILGALATSLPVLIVARSLQGGAVAVVPLGISIIRDELPRRHMGSGIALVSATLTVGAGAGLLVSGVVVEHLHWHALFWIAAGMGALALALVVVVVDESPVRTPARVDLPGALGLSAALVCALVALTRGSDWGWTHPLTLGLVAASAALFTAWRAYEMRVADPLVDLRAMMIRPVLLTNLAGLAVGFVTFVNFLATTEIVQMPRATGFGFGESVVTTGLCIIPSTVGTVLLAAPAARMSARFGAQTTLLVGATTCAVGFALRPFLSASLLQLSLTSLVVAAGSGVCYAALPTLILDHVPRTESGSANGINTLARAVGSSIASALVSALLTTFTMTVGSETFPSLAAFDAMFLAAGLVSLLAAGTAVALMRERAQEAFAR